VTGSYEEILANPKTNKLFVDEAKKAKEQGVRSIYYNYLLMSIVKQPGDPTEDSSHINCIHCRKRHPYSHIQTEEKRCQEILPKRDQGNVRRR